MRVHFSRQPSAKAECLGGLDQSRPSSWESVGVVGLSVPDHQGQKPHPPKRAEHNSEEQRHTDLLERFVGGGLVEHREEPHNDDRVEQGVREADHKAMLEIVYCGRCRFDG